MPTSSERFWESRRNAARFKHHVVKNQLGAFVGKTGSTATDHRVAFLDGYAGPGSYGSGEPGSPRIAVDVADALATMRNVDGYFIELGKKAAKALRRLLDERGYAHWHVRQGSCAEQLPQVLKDVGDCPLLVFLDPYGLGIPFEMLLQHVLSRPTGGRWQRQKKTEVILHFSLSGLHRMGGFLDKDYSVRAPGAPAAATPESEGQFRLSDEWDDEEQLDEEKVGRDAGTAERLQRQQQASLRAMDDFLGGPWWRDVKRSGSDDWPKEVLHRWIQQVRDRTLKRWGLFDVPVPQTWDGPPAYYLVLLTQSKEGVWVFNEGVSKAYEHLYEETWVPPSSGTLFDDGTDQERPDLGVGYVAGIADNIRTFVAGGRSGRVIDHLGPLYGQTLGRARATHLLKAMKIVYGEERLAGDAPKASTLRQYMIRARSS